MNLTVKNLTYAIKKTSLLSDVSLDVSANEFVAILGPNGAGKSTLLKCIAGEISGTGSILINEKAIQQITPKELATIRAVLPQTSQLGFSFKVRDVVMFGRFPHRNSPQKNTDQEVIQKVLQLVDASHLIDRYFPTLSGGEKARVQCARVLAQLWNDQPTSKTLMLDEPTASLDLKHQVSVLGAARAFCEQPNCATIAVLHDVNLAARFATRIIWLSKGRLLAQGQVHSMLSAQWIKEVYGVEMLVTQHPTLQYPVAMAL